MPSSKALIGQSCLDLTRSGFTARVMTAFAVTVVALLVVIAPQGAAFCDRSTTLGGVSALEYREVILPVSLVKGHTA